MKKQILKMKLTPPVVSDIFKRQELCKKIYKDLKHKKNFNRKLTLVSAPAGYGKTYLLLNFFQEIDNDACWLTLSEEDNSPDSMLAYLLAAIREIFNDFGQEVEGYLPNSN